jgi:FkbM family methyltransferase
MGVAIMYNLLKNLSSRLPKSIQQELKRLHYANQIRTNQFEGNEPEYDRLELWVKPGDWVIDIGANIGHYTMKLSRLVKNVGRVFAVEPVQDTFEQLAANASRFPYKNVTLINIAASDNEFVHSMKIPKMDDNGLDNYYMAQLIDDCTISDIRVYCMSLDCFHFPEKIKFIKVDVEGHELSTLKGMKNLITRDHPTIVVEGHTDEVISYLEMHGYEGYRFKGSPNTLYEVPD